MQLCLRLLNITNLSCNNINLEVIIIIIFMLDYYVGMALNLVGCLKILSKCISSNW